MHRPMTPTALRGCAALLGVAALAAMLAPSLARADTVTDWNAPRRRRSSAWPSSRRPLPC